VCFFIHATYDFFQSFEEQIREIGTDTIAAEDSKVKFMGEVRDNVFEGGVRKRPTVLNIFGFMRSF